jgi:hypothetical protein
MENMATLARLNCEWGMGNGDPARWCHGVVVRDAAGIGRSMIHDAAGIGRNADHDAAGIGRIADHDAAGIVGSWGRMPWVGRGTTPAMPGMDGRGLLPPTWHHRVMTRTSWRVATIHHPSIRATSQNPTGSSIRGAVHQGWALAHPSSAAPRPPIPAASWIIDRPITAASWIIDPTT